MAQGYTVQHAAFTTTALALVVSGCIAWNGWAAFSQPATNEPGAENIRTTGFVVAFVWTWCWPIAFDSRRERQPGCGWNMASLVQLNRRIINTLGCLLCLFHIAVAFHVGHEWSHRKAFEHTERASGFGWGVWVNYTFALVWVADVAWMWLAFDHYLKRPRWLRWSVVGFMGFIVFNAAFVFGSGANRWLWLAFASVLVVLVVAPWRWWGKRTPFSGGPNGSAGAAAKR